MAMPSTDAVAVAFLEKLRALLDPADFAEMVAKQKANPIPDQCYSQDYCDANEAMDAAMHSLGYDPLPDLEAGMSQETCDLWNASWELAKVKMAAL